MACVAAGAANLIPHAGMLEVPDFDAVIRMHLPPPTSEYFDPFASATRPSLFDLPRFHAAMGAQHHTEADPEHPKPKGKFMTRIRSVNNILHQNDISTLLDISPGQARPFYLKGAHVEEKHIKAVFDSLDKDKSGELEIDEMRKAFGRMGFGKYALDTLMKQLDVDQSGKVSYDEFRNCINFATTTDPSTEPVKHAGTWINEIPDAVPHLDLGPIGYSKQWRGEERMGGGWSSAENPLSGDKIGHYHENLDPHKREELPEDAHITKDEDGNQHVVNKKKASDCVGRAHALRTSSLLI
eukprot:CAMPEP_0184326322 /NCGR_PEP_ID=MMETSP1049-20130417/142488_1 /TAXON_ID=77928 /ORGANISM="Proteomonas sulcata, Strain CCMP704" /LENGTH=296 /DNA_ID=CAMNT_0026648509 /DNA_START=513 /DNA_END=1403 /DNA_ORIENTATION=-